MDGAHERGTVRRGRAVVRRDVDGRRELPGLKQEISLSLLGRVAHEEHREAGALKAQDERGHVDLRVVVRREDA